MSLDVYLTMPGVQMPQACEGVLVREDGQTREITRAEWDRRNPGREPVVVLDAGATDEVYADNITHNLNTMAEAAGLYRALWRPDELDIARARDLMLILRTGLTLLREEPTRFQALNPANGWGTYEGLVAFVEGYLRACEAYPEATVRVSR